MDGTNKILDEKGIINVYLKSFRSLWRFTNDFGKIRARDKDALEKLEKAVLKIPEVSTLCKEIEEYKKSCQDFIDKARNKRIESFRRHEASYIREVKEQGIIVREYSGGWRIGKLQLNTKPEAAKCRILYNNELVINWASINDKEDFVELEEKANKMLDDCMLDEEELIGLLWEAYRQGLINSKDKANSKVISIHDFYREFRIVLIRKQLEGKKFTRKINKYLEFPLWAFLYNLDMYRSWGSRIPDDKKIVLQTGSMQETSSGKGFVVNGINANEEYKMMCYVYSYKGGNNLQ